MNHKKFIQLLNLYVDGEASPGEIRDIEREIEINPARRRVYDDYRRMQEATRLLYSTFRTPVASSSGAAAQIAPARRIRTAVALPGRQPGRPFRRVLFWTGGAAAACFALAVSFLSMPRSAPSKSPVQTADAPGVSVPVAEAAPAIAATDTPDTYAAPFAASALARDAFVLKNGAGYGDPFSLGSNPRAPSFNDPELILSSVPSLDAARFAPASSMPLDARVAEQNRKLQAILRGTFTPKNPAQPRSSDSAAVPVTFQP